MTTTENLFPASTQNAPSSIGALIFKVKKYEPFIFLQYEYTAWMQESKTKKTFYGFTETVF